MIKQWRILLVGAALMGMMSLMISVAAAQDPDQGQVTWSEEASCRRCHGDAAEGAWAGSIAGTDITLEELTEQVRNGGRNVPFKGSGAARARERAVARKSGSRCLPKVGVLSMTGLRAS
jgi:hypothetical protein